MIRYSLLTLAVIFLSIYAFKEWFRSLSGLIVLMALLERADMPTNMFGVVGLNPWNIIMFFVLVGYFTEKSRRHDSRLEISAPGAVGWLGVFYIFVILASVVRMLFDVSGMNEFYYTIGEEPSTYLNLFVDGIVNSMKWLIPGYLVYRGCDSKDRWIFATSAIGLCCILFAIQVIKQMPVTGLLDGDSLQKRAMRVLGTRLGYHRVDLGAILAGATWFFFSAAQFSSQRYKYWISVGCSGICFLALLLTGGRAGLLACFAVGVSLALLKWRRLILLAPIVVAGFLVLLPQVQERIFEGFSEDSYEVGAQSMGVEVIDEQGRDLYAITSGRVVVWPFVIDKIADGPFFGFGRYAMLREGISLNIIGEFGTGVAFAHPHNAYLEILLDTGFIGTIPILCFYLLVVARAARMLRFAEKSDDVFAGAICLSFVISQLVSALGAQSFYPREGVVIMWCSIGLLYCSYVRRAVSIADKRQET